MYVYVYMKNFNLDIYLTYLVKSKNVYSKHFLIYAKQSFVFIYKTQGGLKLQNFLFFNL